MIQDPMQGCPVSAFCLRHSFDVCSGCCGWLPLEDAEVSSDPLCYLPVDRRAPEHPLQTKRLADRKAALKVDKERRRSKPFTDKSRLVRRAYKNERQTRDAIVRATHRSGAANGDGDSRLGDGTVGIDDKLQSKSTHQFIVKVAEVEKARAQGCILVITTGTGRKFALAELDFYLESASHIAELTD